jgi:hypothetical protein
MTSCGSIGIRDSTFLVIQISGIVEMAERGGDDVQGVGYSTQANLFLDFVASNNSFLVNNF